MSLIGGLSGGGIPGPPGTDGTDGADGADGNGWARVAVAFTQPSVSGTVTAELDPAYWLPDVGAVISGAAGVYQVTAAASPLFDMQLLEQRGVAPAATVPIGSTLGAAGQRGQTGTTGAPGATGTAGTSYLADERDLGVDTSISLSSFSGILTFGPVVVTGSPLSVMVFYSVSGNCSANNTTCNTRLALASDGGAVTPLTPPGVVSDTAGDANGKAGVGSFRQVTLPVGSHVFHLQVARSGSGTFSIQPIASPGTDSARITAIRLQ